MRKNRPTRFEVARSLQDLEKLWRPPEKESGPAAQAAIKTKSPENSKPQHIKIQAVYGLQAYERLRAEFTAAYPTATEVEILEACISFARVCGLIVSARLMETERSRHEPS